MCISLFFPKPEKDAFPLCGRRHGAPTAAFSNGSKAELLRLFYHELPVFAIHFHDSQKAAFAMQFFTLQKAAAIALFTTNFRIDFCKLG
jgi:hypothetical protein